MLGCVCLTPAGADMHFEEGKGGGGGGRSHYCAVSVGCWHAETCRSVLHRVVTRPTSCSYLLCVSVHHSSGLGFGMQHCSKRRPVPHLGVPQVRQDIDMPLLALCRPLPHLHHHPPGQVWRPQRLTPMPAAAALRALPPPPGARVSSAMRLRYHHLLGHAFPQQ